MTLIDSKSKDSIATTFTPEQQSNRMKRIALLFSFLIGSPVFSGDMGLNDEKLAGLGDAMQHQRYDQREFVDREGTQFVFTKERLTATVSDKRRKWIEDKNTRKLGNINFEAASKEAYTTPDQVISYDYFLQKGTGLYFKIFYKTREGGKSLASIQITDENRSKSFHNTFIFWASGRLDEGAQLQEKWMEIPRAKKERQRR